MRSEKRRNEKKKNPQINMSELYSSQFIFSEIMTMQRPTFYTKIKHGVLFCFVQLYNGDNSIFQHAKTAGPKGDTETALGKFAHIQMSFLLFSRFILYERGLEEPEFFSLLLWSHLVPAKIFSLNMVKHVCPRVIFPGPQKKLLEK